MSLFKTYFEEIDDRLAQQKRASAQFESIYTPRAKQVLALARKEARLLNHNFIGTEHVLLGLIKLGQGIAAIILRQKGLDLEQVRVEVERCLGRGPEVTSNLPPPFTPRVKRVLTHAANEAKALAHTCAGTEHILVGLLAEGDGVAARVLKEFGLDISHARQEIQRRLDPNFGTGN